MDSTEVIILAGGLGTRLRGVFQGPKVMAPVNNNPFVVYILDYLSQFNVSKVIFSLGYKHEEVISWLETQKFPFEIDYTIETFPLGTGGAIKLALTKTTKKQIIILNGDTFFRIDLNRLIEFQTKNSFEMSLALKPMYDFDRYGNVLISEDATVKSFEEKHHCIQGNINGGIYALNNSKILESFPESFSLETDYLSLRATEGKIGACVFDDYFIDIGIPSDYQKSQEYFYRR